MNKIVVIIGSLIAIFMSTTVLAEGQTPVAEAETVLAEQGAGDFVEPPSLVAAALVSAGAAIAGTAAGAVVGILSGGYVGVAMPFVGAFAMTSFAAAQYVGLGNGLLVGGLATLGFIAGAALIVPFWDVLVKKYTGYGAAAVLGGSALVGAGLTAGVSVVLIGVE